MTIASEVIGGGKSGASLLSAERYSDKTLGEKAIAGVLDIHRGAVLGWPGKLMFMIAVTGVLLYLSRRKLRRPAQPRPGRLVPGE